MQSKSTLYQNRFSKMKPLNFIEEVRVLKILFFLLLLVDQIFYNVNQ